LHKQNKTSLIGFIVPSQNTVLNQKALLLAGQDLQH